LKMKLSSMQVRFLRFAVERSIYGGFNNGLNSDLPAKGAVARTVADSLRRRGLITPEGRLTGEGRLALEENRHDTTAYPG
jgi:hypothetical protein